MSYDVKAEPYEDECDVEACVKEEGYDAEPEVFNPVEYEQNAEQRLRRSIERDIGSSKKKREKMEIDRRLAKKLFDEYYKDNPNDAPYYITRMLDNDKDIKDGDSILNHISEDDINTLETEVKKLNARQTEIFEHFCNKEKFNELRSKRMTGQYVSEYKKIEGLKSVLLDRLQMIYLGKPFGESFNSNFCEPTNYNGQNREYRF